MPIEGISNLLLREIQPATSKRQTLPERPAESSAASGETGADLKELLAARLERVRAHAANMRTYTERAKVQLDTAAATNSEVDFRA